MYLLLRSVVKFLVHINLDMNFDSTLLYQIVVSKAWNLKKNS